MQLIKCSSNKNPNVYLKQRRRRRRRQFILIMYQKDKSIIHIKNVRWNEERVGVGDGVDVMVRRIRRRRRGRWKKNGTTNTDKTERVITIIYNLMLELLK